MPLVVPALRIFVVFLNVYETFKTLKPPPPSARRGGQPSIRALTQRKRDLKGCLAVWVVWCCYAVYERTFDRVVGIFLPFYSEIKSVFLLFLLLTRAKGAEPLFLHVLRPLVKPYTAMVDPMLELSRDLGDFIFALLQVPVDYILSSSWFPSWCPGNLEEELGESTTGEHISSADSGSSTRMGGHSNIPVLVDRSAVQASRVLSNCQGTIRSDSDRQRSSNRPAIHDSTQSRTIHRRSSTTSLPAYSEHPYHDPPQYSQTLSRHNGHQIWYPPTSAHHEAPISSLDPIGTAPEYHSPEWRTYPAFPSAYPPTPLPALTSLPNSVTARTGTDHHLVPDSAYPPIPEDEQGFGDMLERAHGGYPGSMRSSSNGYKTSPGANRDEGGPDSSRQPDEDSLLDDSMCSSEAGLSEDDFGSSLRTPHRAAQAMLSSVCSSVESLGSAVQTTLRTKTSSDSLSSASLAGQKRTHWASQEKTRRILSTSHSRNATLRGRPAPRAMSQDLPESSASEDEDEIENGVGGDDSSTKAKRRRVLDPLKRKSTVRPSSRGLGNAHKTVPSRSATVRIRAATTITQGTALTRTGSVNSPIKGRKPIPASRPITRGRPQGVIKSSSTSSSQSGTLKGRAF